LSRKRNEVIQIGENIFITVADIRGDKVRIGIQAPKEISVNRVEVQQIIDREMRDDDNQLAEGDAA